MNERDAQRRLDNRQEPEAKQMTLREEWEMRQRQMELLDIKIRNLILIRESAEARCREIAVVALEELG